MDTKTFIITM